MVLRLLTTKSVAAITTAAMMTAIAIIAVIGGPGGGDGFSVVVTGLVSLVVLACLG